MADLAATDVTLTEQFQAMTPMGKQSIWKVAFGDGALTYPSGGVPITKGDVYCPNVIKSAKIIDADDSQGYLYKWDYENNKIKILRPNGLLPGGGIASALTGTIDDNNDAATLGHALYLMPLGLAPNAGSFTAEASATGLITDSDTAATEGVQIYVVVDEPDFHPSYQLGHLEYVSPTDANGTCTVANGAATLTLFDDDDAATNGVEVRAVAAGAGLEATTAASKDILVQLSDGTYIHINHATTASTPAIYFDEDSANTYERLRAVVVDNGDEPYKLFVHDATSEYAPFVVSQGFRKAMIVTSGPKPFTYQVGSGGPELTIPSRPDIASVLGAVPLYIQAAGAGFNAANFGKEDVYVELASGQLLPITYAASPAGVQVYGYPEAASTDLSILGVIADNADETFTVPGSELSSAVDAPAATTLYMEFIGY